MNKSMPFGTKIYIDGVGERIVQDRGGAIKGNRIDLYFENHQEANNFGRQKRKVTILK
jgi:3D (Asp-Asp-Asp) domain-containing protein